MKCENII